MKNRIRFIFVILFFFWVSILVKAVVVQVFPNEKLARLQRVKFNKKVKVRTRRGIILDRNGVELAATIPSYSLYADPKILKNPRRTARKLNKFFKTKDAFYKKIKNRKKRFVWLKRSLTRDQKDKIEKWKNKGLGFLQEPKRVYPSGHIASQVLGFVGREDKGLEGLEYLYDKEIRGQKKQVILQRDARGRALLSDGQTLIGNFDGHNIHTTIDFELQYRLEAELRNAVKEHSGKSAVGIILNAKTSEVLAIANVPTFDPGRPGQAHPIDRKNRSVTDSYEMGSVMKTFVLAGALDLGLVDPKTKIFCENGKYQVGNRWIRESSEKHSFGTLSVSDILARSSNVGTAKIALQMGDKAVYEVLSRFGFGKKTEVGLPGESSGILHKVPWRKHLLSNVSFGHGFTATPIQVAAAYGAIAADGILRTPHIVHRIEDSKGKTVFLAKQRKSKRVISKEKASAMKFMLMHSVSSEQGTGRNAMVYGYSVAGKTGTAQKVKSDGRGYEKGAYISSFAGFIPVNKPEFVIYVAVDHPQGMYYGSQVAAPIFSKIASYAVLKYGLPPVIISETDLISVDRSVASNSRVPKIKTPPLKEVPDLRGLTLREVYRQMSGQNVELEFVGSGTVQRTWPTAGKQFSQKRKLRVKLQ